MVVWVCHERARQFEQDPWRYTLEYFEFLDDTARWTHLDQLLLRYPPQSLHVASSESSSSSSSSSNNSGSRNNANLNAAAKAKQQRRERLMENLQVFLDERQQALPERRGDDPEDDEQPVVPSSSMSCHWHQHVPVDPTKMESAISQLLLQDADVQLAYRGNLQLSQGKLLQQGLALWLQAQELYPPSTLGEQWLHALKLQPGTLTSHLVMDRTAASCIHLLPPANAGVATVVGGQAHNNSLLGLLSQPCSTSMGKAKLQVWLRQPLIDLPAIMYRQDAVTALLQGVGKDSLKEALQAFAGVDLLHLASTLSQYAAPASTAENDPSAGIPSLNTRKALKALYQLYLLSTTQLPQLLEALQSFDMTSSQLLQDVHEQLDKLVNESHRCQGLVETVLDLDAAPREYLIQKQFSSELEGLHEEIDQVRAQVDQELQDMQDVWTQASGDEKTLVRLEDCTVTFSSSGETTSSWQFRLPDTNAAKIVENLPANHGMKLHRVLKNGVYFSTRNLRALSAQHQQLSQDYSQHSQQTVRDAMAVAVTYVTVVERAAQLVSSLDVVTALARVAAYSPHGYCKPTLTDSEDNGVGIEVRDERTTGGGVFCCLFE